MKVIILVGTMLIAGCVYAEDCALTVRVLDPTLSPEANVIVDVKGAGFAVSNRTDSLGNARFCDLPIARFAITVESRGPSDCQAVVDGLHYNGETFIVPVIRPKCRVGPRDHVYFVRNTQCAVTLRVRGPNDEVIAATGQYRNRSWKSDAYGRIVVRKPPGPPLPIKISADGWAATTVELTCDSYPFKGVEVRLSPAN